MLMDPEHREDTSLDVARLCPDPCSVLAWLWGLRHLRLPLSLRSLTRDTKTHPPCGAMLVKRFTLWTHGKVAVWLPLRKLSARCGGSCVFGVC